MSYTWNTNSSGEASLFVLNYGTRRVLIKPPRDYDLLQKSIRQYFPEIPANHCVTYHTRDVTVCQGALTQISAEIWEIVIPLLKTIIVLSEAEANPATCSRENAYGQSLIEDGATNNITAPLMGILRPQIEAATTSPSNQAHQKILLNIHMDEQRFEVRCPESMSIFDILGQLPFGLANEQLNEYVITWKGSVLSGKQCKQSSIKALGMKDGDNIEVSELGFAKPVIYLLPPTGTEMDATVTLSLIPGWYFSAIYPVVPIAFSPSGANALRWDVRVHSDTTLLEKATGLEVAYLFWEAKPLVALPLKDAESEPLIADTFDPSQPRLDPINSVVLEVATITPYLDSALKALGLHTEARTSFITYWLPSFLKHKYIALRFLSQSTYERAAPLEVIPAPDIVVRIFMLFKGLKDEDVAPGGAWVGAVDSAHGDVARWRAVVGIDEDRSLADGGLFRVLEWGGMEAPQ